MSDITHATMRQRGQITLPADVRLSLGLKPGDSLTLEVQDGSLVLTPSRQRALDARKAIHEAFLRAGITEEELLEDLRRSREEITRERRARSRSA